MPEPGPKVSVVICAYTLDRLKDVREAVASALAQTLPPHQIIVSVDNNRELLERLKVEMPSGIVITFNDGDRGTPETRNAAIRAAAGDIIAFIDDDAAAEKDWLENLVRPFEDSSVAAVGGKIVPQWLDGTRPGWFPEELDWIVGCTYIGLPLQGRQVRNVIGCNMACRTDTLHRIRLFRNPGGMVGKTGVREDTEICLRIMHLMPEALIIYEPGAVVHHKVTFQRTKFSYMLRRSYEEGDLKSTLKRLYSASAIKPLSAENSYLRYLLLTSIPRRLKHIYRWQEFLQIGAISLCVAAVGLGYSKGKIKNWLSRPAQPQIA